MRVIAGEFRSRRLKTLPGLALRPTPDRLREALFNVLAPRIAGVTFLDAYAGSGSVGIEALSRGAGHAVFVEKHFAAANVIRQNLASLQIGDLAPVVQRYSFTDHGEWNTYFSFLDPPYLHQDDTCSVQPY